MANNENNEILSFEELRKKLGMDVGEKTAAKAESEFSSLEKELKATSTKTVNANKQDDFAAQIDEALEKEVQAENKTENNTVVENGKTFVDITAQYVNTEKQTFAEKPQETVVNKKKKVRTFNEIFSDFFGKILPKKSDSLREKIRKVVMDIAVVVIIGCGIAFVNLYMETQAQLKMEEEIKNILVDTEGFDATEYDEAWEEVFAQYPNIQFPEGMNLKYSYLYALNNDLVGWLKIDNTNLDVQVVQTDTNEYYVDHDFYKKQSRYGCPHMDIKNDPKYLDDNTIIYGHHMTDGLMFSNLDKYKTLEGYKESPLIEYSSLYETYYFKVFAVFVTNVEAEKDNGNLFNFQISDFSTDERFSNYVAEIQKRSLINTGVTVQPDDKLLTLVTCTYDFDNARLVVVGRMVRENEEITVDTSEATLNTSPKYPQAWYDKRNMDNPYKDDKNWDE